MRRVFVFVPAKSPSTILSIIKRAQTAGTAICATSYVDQGRERAHNVRMKMRALFLMLVLGSESALAHGVPNLSGVFLRERIESHSATKVNSETDEDPLILDIRQSADTLRVTEMQHGVQATDTYDLSGKPTINVMPDGTRSEDTATFSHGRLVLKSKWTDPNYSEAPATEETWELSPDLQTLTIEPKKSFPTPWRDFRLIAFFTRQPSLQVALKKAQAASGTNKCRTKASQLRRRRLDLGHGVVLGFSSFDELVSNVGFQAQLYGNFFRGLKRLDNRSQVEFSKNGKVIQTYDGSLNLMIIPSIMPHPLYLFSAPALTVVMGEGTMHLPESLLNLRFRIKWVGSESRDLGEVPSDLGRIPFSMDGTITRRVYRIEVPAQGVPIMDSLQVHILSAAGTQLGCISGHI